MCSTCGDEHGLTSHARCFSLSSKLSKVGKIFKASLICVFTNVPLGSVYPRSHAEKPLEKRRCKRRCLTYCPRKGNGFHDAHNNADRWALCQRHAHTDFSAVWMPAYLCRCSCLQLSKLLCGSVVGADGIFKNPNSVHAGPRRTQMPFTENVR